MDLSTLNTIIALVIILLVLSLLVQSLQALLKKLLKLKSGLIVESLEDLFEYIDHPKPKDLVNAVVEELTLLGHASLVWKRPMLDSIAKGDLQRILARLYAKDSTEVTSLQLQVEEWFDPVMQGFEERYARKMKAVAVIVSMVVVVYLNANFFKVYRNLAENDTQRSLIVSKYEEMVAARKAANAQASVTVPEVKPTPPPTPPSAFGPGDTSGAKATPSPSPGPSPSPAQTPSLAVGEAEQLSAYATVYQQFGFEPLTLDQTFTWLASVVAKTQEPNAEGKVLNEACQVIETNGIEPKPSIGKCEPKWRSMSGKEWLQRRRQDVSTLLGWGIMTMLLSVGAPFWQDTLESLFGLKGLIRQKSGTENVAKKSGEGQPKE